jgi:hypothetical protein
MPDDGGSRMVVILVGSELWTGAWGTVVGGNEGNGVLYDGDEERR